MAGGILHLKGIWVTLLALLSCAVWNLIWILLGFGLGSNWEIIPTRLSELRTKYYVSLLVLLGLFLVIFIIWKWTRKRK